MRALTHELLFYVCLLVNAVSVISERGERPPNAGCPVVVDNEANRTLRVALGMYGLVRHMCPEANIARVFYEPLRRVVGLSFEVDTFMAANILTHSETPTDRRDTVEHFGAYKPLSQTEYMNFNPCHISVMDQDMVDYETLGSLNATCGKYGDHWKDKTCRTTHNLLSALHAQRRLGHLIRANERTAKFEYDFLVVARVDVLFTNSIPHALYADVAARAVEKKSVIATPAWGRWGGANDRFALGTREAALAYLERLENVAAYCDRVHGALHSENFALWVIETMDATEHKPTEGLLFRRVRGNGGLHKAQYTTPAADKKCVLHDTHKCSIELVAKVGVCNAQ
jgi:hypothetical protein